MDELSKLRLELGRRKNRGNKIKAGWMDSISKVIGKDVHEKNLLPLDETERFRAQFFERVKSDKVERQHFHQGQELEITNLLKKLKGRVQEPLVLLNDVDFYIGALRLEDDNIFDVPFDVWSVVHEDLSLATSNLEDGLCLELNSQGRQLATYEVSSWGRLALPFLG